MTKKKKDHWLPREGEECERRGDYKETRRNFWDDIRMSRVYKLPKLPNFTLKLCASTYVNYPLLKLLKNTDIIMVFCGLRGKLGSASLRHFYSKGDCFYNY